MNPNRLTDLLALSDVPRWVIVPHLRPQSVGDHTYRVLVIFRELASRLNIHPEVDDYAEVLLHDIAEARTGDIPTPAKERLGIDTGDPAANWSSEGVEHVFRAADLIEAYTFIERYGVGTHAKSAAAGVYAKLKQFPEDWYEEIVRLVDEITFDAGR